MKVSTASTAAVTATTVVERAAGCDAGFQNPPPLSTEPSTPSGVSDRAANSATPAREDRTPAVTAGSDHTADTPSAAAEASPRAAHRGRGARRTPPTASAPRTRVLAPPRPQAASPTAGHHTGALPCRTRSAATSRCGTAAYPRSTVHWPTTSRSRTNGFHTAATAADDPASGPRPGESRAGEPGSTDAGEDEGGPEDEGLRGACADHPAEDDARPRHWAPPEVPACSSPG